MFGIRFKVRLTEFSAHVGREQYIVNAVAINI